LLIFITKQKHSPKSKHTKHAATQSTIRSIAETKQKRKKTQLTLEAFVFG